MISLRILQKNLRTERANSAEAEIHTTSYFTSPSVTSFKLAFQKNTFLKVWCLWRNSTYMQTYLHTCILDNFTQNVFLKAVFFFLQTEVYYSISMNVRTYFFSVCSARTLSFLNDYLFKCTKSSKSSESSESSGSSVI